MNWYKNSAEMSDVVLSTRIRLARNLKQYPFPSRLDTQEKKAVCSLVKEALDGEKLICTDMEKLSPVEAVSLAEKHLISAEFASNGTGRSLLLSEDEDVSIMLCEEDHIRIQIIEPGLSLDEAYKKADRLDTVLENKLNYAFDERIGYLTQCPTDLGTGMRASVLLHLPALSRKGAVRNLTTTVAKLGLTLRGSYGEDGEILGDIYQLSNQVTLGISEKAALQNLNSIALQIVTQEKQARSVLVKDEDFMDKIFRAYGILKSAYKLTSKELTNLISYVRLGAAEGLFDIPVEKLSTLMTELQPATMNTQSETPLTRSQRDIRRAEKVREALG
ncbi:MAG: protein arginine kinase [Clostridia bacterium]|nr:protein arginine kinase [Clostridia bacterium]